MKRIVLVLLAACTAPAEPIRDINGAVLTASPESLPNTAMAHLELYRFHDGVLVLEAMTTVSRFSDAFPFVFELTSAINTPRFLTAWVDVDGDARFEPAVDLFAGEGTSAKAGDYVELVASTPGSAVAIKSIGPQ